MKDSEDFEIWLKIALRDLETAEKNLNIEEYHVAVSYAQQAVEKALKAIIMKNKKTLIKLHSPIKLAKEADAEGLMRKLEKFEAVYRETKYPLTESNLLPAEKFDKKDAIEFIKTAEEVIEWVKKKMKL